MISNKKLINFIDLCFLHKKLSYFCIAKWKWTMNKIMRNFGYSEGYYPNEWKKKNWTVRFFDNEVEAYDNPLINTPGKYFHKDLDKIEVEDLLIEIDKFII